MLVITVTAFSLGKRCGMIEHSLHSYAEFARLQMPSPLSFFFSLTERFAGMLEQSPMPINADQ